jgi:hypothetical protein
MRINFETNGLSNDIIQKIKVRNEKIQTALQNYGDVHAQHHGENHKIVYKHMNWSYVMCYGANNYFNFESLQGKICLLNGQNAIGKTAFLDVICIGLYGEPSKQRKMLSGKKMGGKMIHDHRPENNSMSVNILFTLNNDYYEIHRSFTKQGRGDASKEDLRQMMATICTVNMETKIKSIICEGVTTVDDWVIQKFGTIDDILISTFVSQTETNNFFHLKQEEQKAIYDKAVHLESIAAFGLLLKESILAHNDIISMIQNTKTALNDLIKKTKKGGDTSISLQSQIEKYSAESAQLEEFYKKCVQIIGNYEDLESDEDFNAVSIKKQLEKDTKKLGTLGIITDTDKKKAVLIEGEQNAAYLALQKEKSRVGEPLMEDTSLSSLQEHIAELKNTVEKYEQEKPSLQLSPELLEKELQSLKEWEDAQDTDWLENPDALETQLLEFIELKKKYEKKYEDCIKNSISKPRYVDSVNSADAKQFISTKEKWTKKDLADYQDILNELGSSLNTLIKSQVIPCRDEGGFKKWRSEYNAWKTKIADVSGEDEEVQLT